MGWLILLAAGALEVVWTLALKYADGFTKLVPSLVTVAAMAASTLLLGWSLRYLPLGTAYAVWGAIGAVGTAILGILLFGEGTSLLRLGSIALIVAGSIGLKIAE
ncbi:quaternary ammonium compound efflux SMR transporter SugE [Oharaeibacter diazotrophicus]|uniref:Guanidinium exporter n=1 Tax=Oharaeibacter diazotrophicus TaxID=1920512 RepID=A0A4R6RKQ3_9HYPH|nr:quaternary ammonium compound efflux SMR transporter SugE [Oharaeibacter diazotrophicus]TDP87080.1 quaternary ammonium compound-resistance protein SugE [Oharaeibacter diazotrophicus]BBE70977.1 quaternary ammonium compound-resistance protein SugE [Pleomorphomonas sp. SM30]GLS77727.1 hypothetical protein GCM10007904_30640 [Oharaeibacter diazotrophicus]